MKICRVFGTVVEFAYALGARDLKALPGCWESEVDDHWWVAINGHDTPTKCSHGAEVEPCGVYIEFNGFPAGSCNAAGGILAFGDVANEETFCEAVEKATERAATSKAQNPEAGL